MVRERFVDSREDDLIIKVLESLERQAVGGSLCVRWTSVGEKQKNGEADAGSNEGADGGVSSMCQVQTVRLYHLSSRDVALVSREKRESKVTGGLDSGQALCPEPDAIDIPLSRDGHGAVGQRSLCLVQGQGLRRLIGEEALPLRKGYMRITSLITVCKDTRQRRKKMTDMFGMFLERVSVS
jgi:hypothetical protein